MGDHGRLLARRRCGFCVAGIGRIAQCVNIRPGLMPQAVGIDIDPARPIGQRAYTDKIRRHLGRYHMQQVEVVRHQVSTAIDLDAPEGRRLCRSIDRR
ncbi:hypothetical protein D3C76_1687120 [compost metagenome]